MDTAALRHASSHPQTPLVGRLSTHYPTLIPGTPVLSQRILDTLVLDLTDPSNLHCLAPGHNVRTTTAAQANNLIKAGYDVTVWNRTADRCNPLVEAGAKCAASAKEVAQKCDITFAMLADPTAALEVAVGKDGIAAGEVPEYVKIFAGGFYG